MSRPQRDYGPDIIWAGLMLPFLGALVMMLTQDVGGALGLWETPIARRARLETECLTACHPSLGKLQQERCYCDAQFKAVD